MSQISIASGLPCCQNPNKIQTNLSRYLRITVAVLGIIAAIAGTLILFNIPGVSALGTTVGWVAVFIGAFLALTAASIRCVKSGEKFESPNKAPPFTQDSPNETAANNKKRRGNKSEDFNSQVTQSSDILPTQQQDKTSITSQNFPPIFNLELEESSPLLQALPTNEFLHTFGDISLLSPVLNTDEIIKPRIDLLEQAIQLKKRINYLDRHSPFNTPIGTVKDLFPEWDKSPLRLKLMMDDELCSLKTASIAQLDAKEVRQAIGSRIILQSRKDTSLPQDITKENIGEILVIDLPKLTAQQINAYPKDFPPIVFLLIASKELRQIEINQLSKEQLQLLFSEAYQALTGEQIDECVSLMDQEIFNHIFETGEYSKAADLLPKLSLEKIYELVPFFSDDHWKYIGDKHALKFEFSQIIESDRKRVFDVLFNCEGEWYSKAADLLPKLSLEKIYELAPFFSDDHWKYISDEHALKFEFSQIDESDRKRVFDILFNCEGEWHSKAIDLLPKLSLEKIYELAPFFSDDHWKYIGDKHTLKFEFSQIIESDRKRVFDILFSVEDEIFSKASILLLKLSLERIHELIPFFSDRHWLCLDDEKHILKLDFNKIEESKRQQVFNIIFNVDGGSFSRAAKLLPQLTIQRQNELKPYFSEEHKRYLFHNEEPQ